MTLKALLKTSNLHAVSNRHDNIPSKQFDIVTTSKNLYLTTRFIGRRLLGPVGLFYALVSLSCASCYNILIGNIAGTTSHIIPAASLAQGLAERGHNVTFVVARRNKVIAENVRQLVVPGIPDIVQLTAKIMDASAFQMYKQVSEMFTTVCDAISGNEEFKSHLKRTKYDVFIVMSAFQTCLASTVLSHQNEDIPLIMYHPGIPMPPVVSPVMGFDTFYAANSPSAVHAMTDEMSFTERATSLMTKYKTRLFLAMIESNFGPVLEKNLGTGYPDNIVDKVSLLFLCTNFEYEYPFAKTPDVIMTGCLQCRDGKPLPPDLKSFVDGSGKSGVIVFSLGSVLRTDTMMAKEMVDDFKEAFRSLPQRVIWHTDSTNIQNLPKNVKIMKWLPVQDLLAHEKTKLFISHGGYLSLQESMYHGMPYLGFDIKDKSDRRRNVKLAQHRGFGLRLDEHNFTKEVIVEKINELIHDSRYKKNAERIKGYLRDQLVSPKDKAVHMTEYVIRHNGAKHLKSNARNLTTIQLYMLDVLFVATVAFVAVMWILIRLLKLILNLCRRQMKIKRQ